MKEHEKSFCRARVAFEENRKLKGDEQEESNSGEHSPVSVSPPPSSTQEAVSTHTFVQFPIWKFQRLPVRVPTVHSILTILTNDNFRRLDCWQFLDR